MQSQIELTARGRLCLILLHLTAGAAWLTSDGSARLAASMLAAPFLVDLIHKRLRRPRLELSLKPRRTEAGATFFETLEVRNLSEHRAVHDLRIAEPRTHTHAGGALVPVLSPRSTATVRLGARSRRRGIARVRSFSLETYHPLGMFRWRAIAQCSVEMVTEPARAHLDPALVQAMASGSEDRQRGLRYEGQEYFSLREYRHGEDARHVQARRSATLGILVSKVYRGRQERDCSLILDLRRKPGMPPAINNRPFETSLSVAATLCDTIVARGAHMRCFALDGELRRWEISSSGDAREFLTYLAQTQSVAYYGLSDAVRESLPDGDLCFWIPAGGHHRRQDDRPDDQVLRGEAS